ncbi:MAG: hypothetical protein ACK5HL_00965 [Bacilli bacterium]
MKNNKGYLLYEMIISFTLMSLISVFMITTIINIQKNSNNLMVKVVLETNKASLTKMISNDLINDKLISLKKINTTSYKFIYENKGEVILSIDYNNNIFNYDGYSKKLEHDSYFEESTIITTQTDSLVDINKNNSILTIDIPILHEDLYDDYGIHIVHQFDNRLYDIVATNPEIFIDKLKQKTVSSGDGLYANTPKTNDYTFKGKNPNNFVDYNGYLWRILNIGGSKTSEEKNSIKLVFYGRKNGSGGSIENMSIGNSIYNLSNLNNAYEVSEIKNILNKWFDSNIKNNYSILKTNLCIGLIDTSSNLNISNFTTNECNEKTTLSYNIGLIQPSDFMLASTNTFCIGINNINCKNDNFLAVKQTLNAFTQIGNIDSQYLYKIVLNNDTLSSIKLTTLNNNDSIVTENMSIIPTIYLDKNTLFKGGNGSYEYPYKIG